MPLPYLDAAAVTERVTAARAIAALSAALRDGSAPGHTPARTAVPLGGGELLLMPARVGEHAGIKVASVAPDNPARGLPRIQGVHLVLDAQTLAPVAVLDAVALTLARTAAVSALAVAHLAVPQARHLVVVGTGPQALAHVRAITTVRPIERVTIIGRSPGRVAALHGQLAESGLAVEELIDGEPPVAGRPPGASGEIGASGATGATHPLASADIVACCTTAREPLFDSGRLADHATVVAIGSHEPTAREVDTALVRRAAVVVESRESALREAGDILLAIADGLPAQQAITATLPEVVRGEVRLPGGIPRLFKSVGEAWCDVVVAAAVLG